MVDACTRHCFDYFKKKQKNWHPSSSSSHHHHHHHAIIITPAAVGAAVIMASSVRAACERGWTGANTTLKAEINTNVALCDVEL
jgi:hypothetical protein